MKKINKFILAMILIAAGHVYAVGSEGRGGGDMCEDRIKEIRKDLKEWILKGGPKNGLNLFNRMSVEQYSEAMLEQIDIAKFKCVGPGDQGYPVEIDGTPKVCRFDKIASSSEFRCDFLKFNATNESDQYVQIHHEYAGLADIEIPNGDESHYDISNQITGSLKNTTIKKLFVKTTNYIGNAKVDCFSRSGLHYIASEDKAILCQNVMTYSDIESVKNCFYDSRLTYITNDIKATLCNRVKSHADTETVIQCFRSEELRYTDQISKANICR